MPDYKTKSILIVDDSQIIRSSLESYFSQYNFRIITCSDGLEGIQKAIEVSPDLIFLDLLMPNFDGIKMLQVIKVIDNLKNIPIIVISGNTSKSNVLTAIEAGANTVISKPLQKEILIRKINELLGPEFLEKAKSFQSAEDQQNKEIQQHLLKYFLDNFSKNKLKLINGIEIKDKDMVSHVIHDLKGSGGTIGYPLISIISYEIEKAL
jgi:DNA-binding response OmpR family regulator